MGQKETKVSDEIRLELCKRGCKVFRSQVGQFYTKYGAMINIGVKGESDLHGHRPNGVAFYLETKYSGTEHHRPEQIAFLKAMRESGALAGFANSVEQAMRIVFPEEYEDSKDS